VPSLKPPAGVVITSSGFSGGGNRVGTDATAKTDMDIAALGGFYADELAAAGWSKLDSGNGNMLSWSIWSVPDHGDLQGFLYIRNGPAVGQKTLHVEVTSTDSSAMSLGATFSYSGTASSLVPATALPTPTPAP